MVLPLICRSHRRLLGRIKMHRHFSTTKTVQSVMLLLVESGAFYCAIWVRLSWTPISMLQNVSLTMATTIADLPRLHIS